MSVRTAGLSFLLLAALGLLGCGSSGDDTSASGGATSTPRQEAPATQQESISAASIGPVRQVELGDVDPELASEGEASFQTKCTTCHRLDERMVGPALRGVTARRSPEFVMNMILNPAELQEKHPAVEEMIAEFGTKMTDLGLDRREARAVLEYLRSIEDESPGGAAEPTTSQ